MWPRARSPSAGTITIHGGTVTVTGQYVSTGTNGGAGIGGGYNGDGGTITIHGGTVNATGGSSGMGLGAGIGGKNGGKVTISGGTVTAISKGNGAGIGCGANGDGTIASGAGTFSTGTNGNAVIFASSSTGSYHIQDAEEPSEPWQGVIFLGDRGLVYGDSVTPVEDFEIPGGKTLNIEAGKTLTVGDGGTVDNYGTVDNSGTITIDSNGTWTNKVTGITLAPASTSLTAGDQTTLTAQATRGTVTGTGIINATDEDMPSDWGWTWASDNMDVATVEADQTDSTKATVTAVSAGSAAITAKADSYEATCTVTVKDPPPTYLVTVNGGTGGGSYEAGQTVTVTAESKSGYTFTGWTTEGVTLSNPASATVTFTMPENNVTLTASYTITPGGGGGGGSSGSSSGSTTTETTTNPDGSITTTVTNKVTGTVTETTKWPDGSKEVVETKKDGTVTTTTTDTEGNQTKVVQNPDGTWEITVTRKDGSGSVTVLNKNGNIISQASLSQAALDAAREKGEAVQLPIPALSNTTDRENATAVTVDLPSGGSAKVEIPVEDVTAGTVAILVKDDGSEEVVKTSLTTENGVAVTLNDGDTVKIVDNSKDFTDVSATYWGAEAVDFATSRELFSGTGATTFEPNTAMTRAMIVTVLARLDGVDTSEGDTWYEAGRQWAMASGISDGSNMEQGLTREQLATMLYRYAQGAGYDVTNRRDLGNYPDAGKVSAYAVEALQWATGAGLITDMGDGTLAPQGSATRAQVATILMRFIAFGQ